MVLRKNMKVSILWRHFWKKYGITLLMHYSRFIIFRKFKFIASHFLRGISTSLHNQSSIIISIKVFSKPELFQRKHQTYELSLGKLSCGWILLFIFSLTAFFLSCHVRVSDWFHTLEFRLQSLIFSLFIWLE